MKSPQVARNLAAWILPPDKAANYLPLSVCSHSGEFFIGAMYQEPGKWPIIGTVESPKFDTFKSAQKWFEWIKQFPKPEDWLQGVR